MDGGGRCASPPSAEWRQAPLWAEQDRLAVDRGEAKRRSGQPGFAQSYLDIGAILPTRDGRAIGNATVLAVETYDKIGLVVKLVTDAGNETIMTEREVRTAFHQPKWIRRIDTPADRMRRADEVLAEVRAEIERAITKHRAWSSAHEGYAVIQEEADELRDEVKANRGYTADAMKEAIQVAATGVRYVVDLRRE